MFSKKKKEKIVVAIASWNNRKENIMSHRQYFFHTGQQLLMLIELLHDNDSRNESNLIYTRTIDFVSQIWHIISNEKTQSMSHFLQYKRNSIRKRHIDDLFETKFGSYLLANFKKKNQIKILYSIKVLFTLPLMYFN